MFCTVGDRRRSALAWHHRQVVDIPGPTEFTAGIKEVRDHSPRLARGQGCGMNGGAAIPPVLPGRADGAIE